MPNALKICQVNERLLRLFKSCQINSILLIKFDHRLLAWQYDGSSTYQALGGNSDITLIPRALYRDPFKVGENDVIVVCDTHKPDGEPTESNKRFLMQEAVDRVKDHEPWFGIEQEYTLLDIDERPFGWPENGKFR